MTTPVPPGSHPQRRPCPEGLAAAGSLLWDAVAGVLALEEHEALKLLQLCRAADLLDELQAELDRDGAVIDSPQGRKAHPAAVELRQQRVAFARLIADMRLPAGLADAKAKASAKASTESTRGAPVDGPAQQRRPAVKGVYAIGKGNA